jgi:hypothetical protein
LHLSHSGTRKPSMATPSKLATVALNADLLYSQEAEKNIRVEGWHNSCCRSHKLIVLAAGSHAEKGVQRRLRPAVATEREFQTSTLKAIS